MSSRRGTARRPGSRERSIHLEDLIGAPVSDASGRRIAYVVDVEVRPKAGWEIVALILGRHSFLDRIDVLRPIAYRLGGLDDSELVAWADVERFEDRRVRLRSGARPVRRPIEQLDGTAGERLRRPGQGGS
ncbi:MAG TPA: PRC-barrel domain-containing protein [Candidatus Limnocylindrales bacterium]|nr:PRC-barrel domain-containing protein [Candidatus Limnocylindrales bacterium]